MKFFRATHRATCTLLYLLGVRVVQRRWQWELEEHVVNQRVCYPSLLTSLTGSDFRHSPVTFHHLMLTLTNPHCCGLMLHYYLTRCCSTSSNKFLHVFSSGCSLTRQNALGTNTASPLLQLVLLVRHQHHHVVVRVLGRRQHE